MTAAIWDDAHGTTRCHKKNCSYPLAHSNAYSLQHISVTSILQVTRALSQTMKSKSLDPGNGPSLGPKSRPVKGTLEPPFFQLPLVLLGLALDYSWACSGLVLGMFWGGGQILFPSLLVNLALSFRPRQSIAFACSCYQHVRQCQHPLAT